jgi:AraC-like DNA-binding protein
MTEWITRVETRRPMAGLPRLLLVCAETQGTPAYAHHGRFRQAEPHCILKATVSGEGRYQDARGVHAVVPGQGFLCEIADPRTGYWYPEEGRSPWRFVYAAFAGPTVAVTVRELTTRYGGVLPVPAALLRRMLSFRAGAAAVHVATPVEGAQFVTELLWAVAGEAERQQGEAVGVPDLVRRARIEVAVAPAAVATVAELARRLGVSREHLARVFRQQTGQAPRAFLEWCRLREACRLLKETSMSAKEVAATLGFGAPSHFTRAFGRRFGMPPRRFREVGSVPLA